MRKRPHRVFVHLNDAELAFFQTQLATSGLTMEPYLRRLILEKEIKPRPPRDYKGLYTEINRIGNNINQIARACNQGAEATQLQEQLLFYLSELYKLLDKSL